MHALFTKTGIWAIAITGSVTSTWAAYNFLIPKTVSEHIKWKYTGEDIEKSYTDDHWKRIVNKNNVAFAREMEVFVKWRNDSKEEEKIKLLKRKCHQTLKTKRWSNNFNNEIKNALKFCVIN